MLQTCKVTKSPCILVYAFACLLDTSMPWQLMATSIQPASRERLCAWRRHVCLWFPAHSTTWVCTLQTFFCLPSVAMSALSSPRFPAACFLFFFVFLRWLCHIKELWPGDDDRLPLRGRPLSRPAARRKVCLAMRMRGMEGRPSVPMPAMWPDVVRHDLSAKFVQLICLASGTGHRAVLVLSRQAFG